ncbi:DUF2059 domain-containing protein [Pseudomonas caricapapayae]
MAGSQQVNQLWMRVKIVGVIMGVVGTLGTALFNNWDKLFHEQDTVQATYSGYRPTGNFETEFRYYLEVSGARATMEYMQQQMSQAAKADLIAKRPEDAELIIKYADRMTKEAPRFEDVIKSLMPLYQKHFSLTEIQELNKFYSTDVMQGLVKKQPLLIQEAIPIQMKLFNNYMEQANKSLYEILSEESSRSHFDTARR